jgi:hypothetical protein
MTLFNASSSDFSMNDASRPPIDPQATSAYVRKCKNSIDCIEEIKLFSFVIIFQITVMILMCRNNNLHYSITCAGVKT